MREILQLPIITVEKKGSGRKPGSTKPESLTSSRKGRKKAARPTSDDPNLVKAARPKATVVLRKIAKLVKGLKLRFTRDFLIYLGRACETGINLKDDATEWEEFCKDKFWSGEKKAPTIETQSDAVRFALRRVCGKGGPKNKQASFYNAALGPLVAQGIRPEDLPGEVKARGGLKKLARIHAKPRASLTKIKGMKVVKSAATADAGREGKEVGSKPLKAEGATIKSKKLDDQGPIWLDARVGIEPAAKDILQLAVPKRVMADLTINKLADGASLTGHRIMRPKNGSPEAK